MATVCVCVCHVFYFTFLYKQRSIISGMEYWLAFEMMTRNSGGIDNIENEPNIGGSIKEGEAECM